MRNTINIFAALLIASAFALTPARAQFSPGSSSGGTFTGPFPGNPIDPTIMFNAGAVTIRTTGTISNGSNSLTITGSTAGLAAGLALMVENAGGAAGDNPLEACVSSSYSGGATVLLVVCGSSTAKNATANAIGQNVWNDDTPAFQSAINLAQSTGRPIQIQPGNFITAGTPLSITSQIAMRGAGVGLTTFYNVGRTNDVINIAIPTFNEITMSGFSIFQGSSSPPTSGFGINIIPPTTGGTCSVANFTRMHMNEVNIYNTYNGLQLWEGVAYSSFRDMKIVSTLGGYGLHYHVSTPCGDNVINNLEMAGAPGTTDYVIYSADTHTIDTIKLLGGSHLYVVHEAIGVRLVNPSLENTSGGTVVCGIDFGAFTYIANFNILGGEFAGWTSAFCNTNSVKSGAVINAEGYSNGTSCTGGLCGGYTGTLNYVWPAPVFAGCTPSGTPQGTSDLLNGLVAMTCTAATMTITYNTNSNAVPNNGLLCDVRSLTAPTNLINQTAYSVINNGTMTSSATATFAAVTTSGSETFKYSCRQF